MDETLTLRFGAGGNAAAFLGDGWCHPEPAFTWSVGGESALVVPAPAADTDLLLEIQARPFLAPSLAAQRLIVDVGGVTIGAQSFQDDAVVWFDIGRRLIPENGKLTLRFRHPDATSPAAAGVSADIRVLGFCFSRVVLRPAPRGEPFRAAQRPPLPAPDRPSAAEAARMCTGLKLETLAGCFESLGRNCELGLVQKQFGSDVMGLLRYGSMTYLSLLDALRCGFEGIDDPDNVEIYQLDRDPSREWMIHDKRFGSESHSFRTEKTETAAEVHRLAQMRFKVLRRKTMETLTCGNKICVFQHHNITGLPQVRPLAAALRELGPNMLLWVSEDPTRPPGSVAVVGPGVMHGAIDRLAPLGAAGDGNLLAWTSLMANAYRLWREEGYGQEEE